VWNYPRPPPVEPTPSRVIVKLVVGPSRAPPARGTGEGRRDNGRVKIRVLSVFEGIVYHCWPVDLSNPGKPVLEVDAVLREGDADASSGPLLLSVADYITMVGGLEKARPHLRELGAQGRVVEHLGAQYLSFPMWTRVSSDSG